LFIETSKMSVVREEPVEMTTPNLSIGGIYALVCARSICYRSNLSDMEAFSASPLHQTRRPEGRPSAVARENSEMTSKRTNLQQDTHFRVLRLLQENPETSQRELAQAVGVSVGGIHYVLNALIDKGLVKLGNFTAAKDKRRYAYVLTSKGIARKAALTRAFLVRKMEEYVALREEIESLQLDLEVNAVKKTS
jgi:EPS-associated MarR family transcriptional regulator